MHFKDNLFIQYRNAFSNTENMKRLILEAMGLRYIIGISAMIISHGFHEQLPLPYPHFFLGSILFICANATLHLFSLNQKFLKGAFILLPYFDVGFAPLIIGTSGGFMSPFLITLFLTAVGSGILYTSNKNLALHSFIILLVSYLGIAFLQKSGLIPSYTPYTEIVLHNNIFFYFVISITSLILVAGYVLVKLLNSHVHQTLDDLTGSFDSIIKGTTAVVDKDFFTNLAQRSSETFKVRCVYIAEILQRQQAVQTLVIWHNGRLETNYTIPLAAALAHEIIRHPECRLFEPALAAGYPDDPVTRLFPVRFMFGVPLNDTNGKPIGVLLALNDAPVRTLHLLDPLFAIFASRAAAELERKITDEKRMLVEQQLAHAQKMEAIGHLAGGIAHDFNNIITAIGGYAALLQKKLGAEHPQLRYTKHIIDAAKNASSMTGQLSMFVKNDKIKFVPVDVHQVINDTVSMLSQLVGHAITLNTDLQAHHCSTAGDASLLQNALLNLGINARDACENRPGIISFSTEVVTLDRQSILCQSFSIEPGSFICVSARDNGCGMSKDILDRIFEPFFTTKPKDKGTGLGLANVWRYIETFKGAIEVQSEIDAGSTFLLYLPLLDGDAPSIAPDSSAAHRQPSTKTILIIDDEPSVREIYSEILIEHGYTVHTANDGYEAIDFFDKKRIPVDLVLLDIVMPRLGGPDTFHAIRERCPQIKILWMSGFIEQEEVASLLKEPDTDFFQKTWDHEQLLKHVHLLLSC